MKLTVHVQGASVYVLGTDSVLEAQKVLPAEVIGWDRSEIGAYARRQGYLRWYPIADTSPKDARVGFRFGGVRRESVDSGKTDA